MARGVKYLLSARSPRRNELGRRPRLKVTAGSSFAERFVERIAGAAHGADRVSLAAARQRFAQTSDMNVDGALVDFDRLTPYAVEQLRARKNAAGPLEQVFEQSKFRRAEMNVARAAAHPSGFPVEVEVAGGQSFGDAFGPAAPQQRAHARHQLRDGEGFHDVIVGADRKPTHALDFLAARRQHDHWQGSRRFASA